MANFNKVIFLGRLTHDVKFGYTPKEVAVADFNIAVNRYYKDSTGEKDEVLFIDCRAFGKIAEYLKKNFKKGSPILVEGFLKLESWTRKETKTKQHKYRVVVEHFEHLADKTETETEKTEPKDDIGQRRSGTERPRRKHKALTKDEIPF